MPLKNEFINLGDVQNVYTRRSITIPAGQIAQIDGVHTFFRIYAASGNIEVAAQNTGMFQPITAGTWVKNPTDENGNLIRLPYIRLRNLEAFSITVDLALSNGEVGDDAFVGSAQVDNYETSPLFVQDVRPSNFKLTTLSIPANDSLTFTPDNEMINFIVQNQGTNDVKLFGAAGLVLFAGADFTGNLNKAFDVVNQTGTAAVVVVTEFLR